MNHPQQRGGRTPALLGTILLVALGLRVWLVGHNLPYVYHPDEAAYVSIAQRIFKTGDLNPHFFSYPSLFFYINALAYIPYYLFGKLSGAFQSPHDILPVVSLVMGVNRSELPSTILLGRLITVAFGVGAVGLTYCAGKRIAGKASVGLLGALMVAVSPTSVWHSRTVTPDTFVAFFALATLLAAALVMQEGRTRHYFLAGLCIGLTASSKYNGALVVLPLLAAHVLRHGRAAFRQPGLYLALLLSAGAFLATTPYALLDWNAFRTDFAYEAGHYATGHAGMEGESLRWYLRYMWETGGALYLLAVAGVVYGAIARPKETALLAIFPLVYFTFISSFVVRNDRTLLPLTAFLFLLAAWALTDLLAWARRRLAGPRAGYALAAVVTALALALPLSRTTADAQLLAGAGRESARLWIEANVPAGAKIAVESYAPFIDPSRFSVQGIKMLILHEPDWYVEQGFDYLVFSDTMYGRYYHEPEKYGREVALYERLFAQFSPVRTFAGADAEVLVYQRQAP